MGKKRPKPRRPKPTGQTREKVESFILGVIGSLIADLITAAVRKFFN